MNSKKKAQGFLEVNRKRFWRERFCVVNEGCLKYSKKNDNQFTVCIQLTEASIKLIQNTFKDNHIVIEYEAKAQK
jgi:hypothetical protein